MFQPQILPLFEEYEPLPPRSRLMPLSPMNDSVPLQESLSSYFVRLARRHSLSPLVLLKNEVLGRTNIRFNREATSRFTSNYIRTMNGVNFYAKEITEALKSLTGRSELERCSFLPWVEVLDLHGNGLLHTRPHWCSECFRDWRTEGIEPFFPLLWMAAPVKFCKVHKCRLIDVCPCCNKAQPFLPRHVYLDYCSHCGSWLVAPETACLKNVDDFTLYQFNSLEEMVLNGWRCLSLLNSSSFINSILVVASEMYEGSVFKMERDLGFQRGTVANWVKAKSFPTLPSLLLFCYRLNTSPLEFITQLDHLHVHPQPGLAHRKEASKRKGLSPSEFARVKSTFELIIASGISKNSVESIARDLGHAVTLLRYWFKEECQVISRLHKEYRHSCRMENERRDTEIVKAVFDSLADRGGRISNRVLQQELSLHGVVLSRPHVLAAVEKERKTRLLC